MISQDVQGLILLVGVFALYFLPTIVAVRRGVRNSGPVALIDLFLGWTLIGWVVALAMAAGAQTTAEYEAEHPSAGRTTSEGLFSVHDKPIASGVIKSSAEEPWLRKPDHAAVSGKFLSPGDRVNIIGRSGAFVFLMKGDRGGWVPADAVRITQGTLPAATTPIAPVPATAIPPASSDSALDQLQKLAALHKQGVVTDEEFAAKKRQLLGL